MSTARTVIGCLAEDYPRELATICHQWAVATRQSGRRLDERTQLCLDVADSLAGMYIRDSTPVE